MPLYSNAIAVSNFPASQVVSGAISIGTATGKDIKMSTGGAALATTTPTTIHSYTVTAGKTFYLEYVDMVCRFSTLSSTLADHGSLTLRIGSSNVYQALMVNSTTGEVAHQLLTFSEPMPIAAGTTIQLNAIGADATSRIWRGCFGGYEK